MRERNETNNKQNFPIFVYFEIRSQKLYPTYYLFEYFLETFSSQTLQIKLVNQRPIKLY